MTSHAHRNHDDTDVESRGTEQYFPQRPLHSTRRVSVDSPYFPQPTHATYHEEMDMAPIPPYSPFAPEFSDHSPASSATSPGQISTVDGNPAHSLEEFRNSLQSSLRHVARCELLAIARALIHNMYVSATNLISAWVYSELKAA